MRKFSQMDVCSANFPSQVSYVNGTILYSSIVVNMQPGELEAIRLRARRDRDPPFDPAAICGFHLARQVWCFVL